MEGLRKALDNLMGKDRNLPLREQLIRKKHFDDPDVCKFFLIGFCPHELFQHVKSSNIGECHYRHDQQFKISFESDPKREYYQTKYEESLISFLESITSEVDYKMKRCLERIEAPLPDQVVNKEIQEEIEQLDQQITEKIKQAEHLGEIGMIDDSEKLMKEIEQIKVQRNLLTNTKEYPAIYKDRQMKVCEICGALQSAQDNEKRIQTHKEGKIHSAYLKIRQYLDLLRKKRMERKIKEAEIKQKDKLIKELKMKEKYIDKDYKDEYKDYKYKNYNYDMYSKDKYNDKEEYKKKYYDEYIPKKRSSRSKNRSRSRSRSRRDNKSYSSRDRKKYDEKYYRDDRYGYKDREKRREREERGSGDIKDNRDRDRDIVEGRYYRDREIKDNNFDIRDKKERERDRDRREYRDNKYTREYEYERDYRNKRDDRDYNFSYRYEKNKYNN